MAASILWTQARQAIMQDYKIEKAGPGVTSTYVEEWKTVSNENVYYGEKAVEALKKLYSKDVAA